MLLFDLPIVIIDYEHCFYAVIIDNKTVIIGFSH